MNRIGDRKIVIGLMLLQVAVCAPFLNSFPIDLDEPFSVFIAQQDMSEFIPELQEGNNSPLYFILLHFWIKIFGIGAVAVRSLSLFFSVLTLPILYKLGKSLLEREYALVACLFFIFSTFMHYHSMEARMYSLFVMLTVFAYYDLNKFIFDNSKVFWRLAIWNVLLFYTHYLSIFIIGTEVIIFFFLFKNITQKKLLHFIISGVISLILIVPGLSQLLTRSAEYTDGSNWVPETNYTALYGNIIRFFNHTISISILFGLCTIFILINRKKILAVVRNYWRDQKVHFVILAFVVPYVGMFVVSRLVTPIFLDRYLLFTVPFLYLLVAFIIKVSLQDYKKWYFLVLFVLPLVISCAYVPDTNRETDKVANYVHENAGNNDLIILCPPFYDLTFIYHFDQAIFFDYKNTRNRISESNILRVYSWDEVGETESFNKIIFVDSHAEFLYPNNGIIKGLEENRTYFTSKEFKGNCVVYIYK
ncbi:MAG: glycosyltransferase family 39 protein [Crocinitomicaceae bacterium]|nr:glycosyltransferase family 39 protein [Crocinitomicaceae bacterium]